MSKVKKLKFIIGNSPKKCSDVWTVKVKRDDVYIIRGKNKDHKITLHGSGICHSAMPKESIEKFGMTPEMRTNVRWKVNPPEGNAQIAFTIVYGYNHLDNKETNVSISDKVNVIPEPPEKSAAVIYFVIADACGKEVLWETEETIHLIHSIQLESGKTLAVFYRYTSQYNGMIAECEKKVKSMASCLRPPEPLALSSGFTTVFDEKGLVYHVHIRL